jgi:electron transfer flavoprotein alpha subunit
MNKEIIVLVEVLNNRIADVTFEMLGVARALKNGNGTRVIAVLLGKKELAEKLGAADMVLVLDHPGIAEFTPEPYQLILKHLLDARKPWMTLIASTSIGLDLASSLSVQLDIPLVASTKEIRCEGDVIVATAQLYGGKMFAEVEVAGSQALLSILPGAGKAEAGMASTAPVIEDLMLHMPLDNLRMSFSRLILPAAGDIDLTQVPVLVSVGRGIQNKDNLELAEELAAAVGGAVSASRPVVDQGWLPMTRQIGRSGLIVKPKVYLALGISGAPEHIEGMRDAELIIAVNTDENAPIFSHAHYGYVGDMLDVIPALTEEVRKQKTT